MPEQPDLVIRNGYVQDRDAVVDIVIDDGVIHEISSSFEQEGVNEINAQGDLVSPGFVDCHKHTDRAFAAAGERKPKGADKPFIERGISDLFDQYYEENPLSQITANARRVIEMSVRGGTTHIRSHVGVDHTVGVDTMEACIQAKKETDHLVDLELVPAAFGGITNGDAEERVREAIEMGLEAFPEEDSILVGGTDPAGMNNDIEGTIATWFDLAADYDIDMDVHIQDGGQLGHHTLEALVRETRERGYEGRVTASHCFSLAQAPDWWLEQYLNEFAALDLKTVTCYNSIRCDMPVKELVDSGIPLGHGTDNDRDFVIPHGNSDILEAAQVMSLKLHGDQRNSEEYRWSESNPGLEFLWNLLTEQGSRVLGIEESYGVEEGANADLVVFDKPSLQWAVIEQAERSYVIKDGIIVAEGGEICAEATSAD